MTTYSRIIESGIIINKLNGTFSWLAYFFFSFYACFFLDESVLTERKLVNQLIN